MDRAQDRFEAAGGRLVLIGQLTPRHAAHFRRREQVDVTVLADDDRASYRAAGAKMGGVGQLVGPSVLAKGLATSLRTRKLQTRTIGDPAQLGGSMVIRQDGSVAFAQMAKDAADNVSPDELVAAMQGARA
ncbi:MAG TPA: AhpC/TSA family protein [Solirubrobacteraceae bacterium]